MRQDEDLLRATTWEVTLGAAPEALPALELPAGKRRRHAWPPYRAEDHERLIAAGDASHATRFGRAAALAFEGDPAAALAASVDAVAALEEDLEMLPETFGGVDWEMGFSLDEIFSVTPDEELDGLWDALPRSSTWTSILGKAVHLYKTYRPKEGERILALLGSYREKYEARHRDELRQRKREKYLARIDRFIARRADQGDTESVEHLQRVRARVAASTVR